MYVACSNCGNLNKSDAKTCYSCGQEMGEAPPPPPPPPPPAAEENPWANKDLRVQPVNPNTGSDTSKARFNDLASRYEAKVIPRTDANLLQGLRAGVPAGLLAGVVAGLVRQKRPDEMTRLLVRRNPKFDKKGSQIVYYSIAFDLVLGLLLGLALGLTNLLCFPKEASTVGAILGALAGGVLVWGVGVADYSGIIVGALNGALLGFLASVIELKLFR